MPADSESKLAELGHALLACADRAMLDERLDRLCERVADHEARAVLVEIFEAGEAESLRELFSGVRLGRWVAEVATPREEQALGAQLMRWLGQGARGEDDPARLVAVSAPPEDLEGLLAWARPHGLLGELSRPAREVLIDEGALVGEASVIECCLGRAEARGPGVSLLSARGAEEAARAYLVREAAANGALAARRALWEGALPEGPLRTLAERLRAVIAGTELEALHAVGFVPARRVGVDPSTGTAQGHVLGGEGEGPVGVKLFLSGYEQRAIEGACERCKRPGCLHVRALAGRLLDACFVEHDRLRGPLASLSSTPSWRRFLDALSATEGPPRDGARLSFRVRLEGERASVGAALHASSGGRISAGKLVPARKLARSAARAERDVPVLDAMMLASRTVGASIVPADLTLLRALVEHPYVQLEGGGETLQVREERVEVALVEQPDGLLPKVTLGGVPIPPGERPRDASYLLQHDRARGALVFAALTPALRRLLAALAHFRGVLPVESYPALAPFVATLEKVARVSAPKALLGTERPRPEKLLLRITPGLDEGVDVALVMRALPMAPLWPPAQGPELCHGLEGGVQVFVRRDLAEERERAKRVLAALELERHPRLEPFAFRIEGTEAALELLSRAARIGDLVTIEWAEHAPRLTLATTIRASDLHVRLFKKGPFFAVGGAAKTSEGDLAVGRLLDAARRGERFVQVKGRDYVAIERELFERLQLAQLAVMGNLREPMLSVASAPYWLERLGQETTGGDDAAGELLARLRDRDASPVVIPDAIGARLRDYQREGLAWLLERSRWAPGVCLADEMGLGKTVQAIALLEMRAALGPALVVAPTSVVGHWVAELARFAPALEVYAYRGPSRHERVPRLGPRCVLVTSYELLLRDRARFDDLAFATQVVDEAQMVKNARTKRARAVASVDAGFRVALSGTPIENRLGDLFSLFQLVAPGLLGTWARFRAVFAVPIERYEDEARAEVLRALVAPFVLRRTKSQVAAELPSRTEVVHRVELSPAEQTLYDAAVRRARRALGKRRRDDAARNVQILAELTHLRQLASHPRLVLDDERAESSKLNALRRLLEDILPRGHRALIFSQFTRHLALVREALAEAGITHLSLDGSTPGPERTRLVERFQAGEGQVFLISLKAGGTGLHLTAADYVVHMDPWWNPAVEDQASDRAHRLGQVRPITIVKLVAQGTIEEKVLELHEHKRRLAEVAFADAPPAAALDADALEELLALA